jgi:hypothetical protein
MAMNGKEENRGDEENGWLLKRCGRGIDPFGFP